MPNLKEKGKKKILLILFPPCFADPQHRSKYPAASFHLVIIRLVILDPAFLIAFAFAFPLHNLARVSRVSQSRPGGLPRLLEARRGSVPLLM